MRYQDWDILLFPHALNPAPAPLKEFGTSCYVEQYDSAGNPTPLLTTFVPSLQAGSHFQISVHSWVPTNPCLMSSATSAGARELWQVRVVIDGNCACTEMFPVDIAWPQVIKSAQFREIEIDRQVTIPLRFPQFHRTIMSQNHWDASDTMGRIRVELAVGYAAKNSDTFVKMQNIVHFSFQHSPLDLLERAGIAWPNPRITTNALSAHGFLGAPAKTINIPNSTKHKKVVSNGHVNGTMFMPGPPTAPPVCAPNLWAQGLNGAYEGSSRSTSAYSTVTDSAAPLLRNSRHAFAYPGTHTDMNHKSQFAMRLPSDQLQQIINAVNASSGMQQQGSTSGATMLPPPLPAYALAAKDAPAQEQHKSPAGQPADPIFGQDFGADLTDRRTESRYSDISMHPACNSFPSCTTEDEEGHLVHSTPDGPAFVVKGRKEGSSPTKPRDFFSTILETMPARPSTAPVMTPAAKTSGLLSSSPADTKSTQSKKRTRSAMKSLNINDGSPEKRDTTKPLRKSSRASASSAKSDKENVPLVSDDLENMVTDA